MLRSRSEKNSQQAGLITALSGAAPTTAAEPADAADAVIATVEPRGVDELQAVVRLCAAAQARIVPRGGGGQPLLERPTDGRPQVIVSTARLNRVLDHPPGDLTITVQAGVTLAELAAVAGPRGEQLALDPPGLRHATVGGVICTNACGPRQLRHGPVSHHLLAATMVLADGRCVRSGARTVKNVAGYDVHKLCIGSFGCLAVIAEATLRLKPAPEALRLVEFPLAGPPQAADMLKTLRRGPTRPALLSLLNARAAAGLGRSCPQGRLILIAGFEDDAPAVEWQVDQAASAADAVALDERGSAELYQRLVDWPLGPADYAFEAVLPQPDCMALISAVSARGAACMAQAASGVAQVRGDGLWSAEDHRALLQCCPKCSVKFHRLPAGATLPQWVSSGDAAGSGPARWMWRLKEYADPALLLPVPGFLQGGCARSAAAGFSAGVST